MEESVWCVAELDKMVLHLIHIIDATSIYMKVDRLKLMIVYYVAQYATRQSIQARKTINGFLEIMKETDLKMKTMEITLIRKYKLKDYTIGKLYIDGVYFCDTIEDADRGLYCGMGLDWIKEKKIYGETAIPYGRYKVTLKFQSPKYANKKQYEKCKGYIPRLLDVPGFDGILIHIGNFAKDSYGCILLGENKVKGAVVNSTIWFWKFYDIVKQADDEGKDIYITIQP